KINFTVDEFYLYSLTKNPSIYTLYAAQFKELLYSNYYLETFGEELDISENNSDRMDEIRKSVENEKSYYLYYKSMYEQFGMEYPHDSFLDYVYSQHGTKTEKELLEYYVTSELRPYLINDVVMDYEVPGSFMETIQDNYENYFSLDVTQLLIFIDFDEDGSPDDFNEYRDALDTTGLAEFNSLLARLETAINDYEGNYESLVSAYAKATRENETWGEFKTKGILLKFEDLNFTDQQQSTSHSVNYSGEYGVKDQFIEEFTQALIDLYQLYISYQNPDLDELESDLILTEFGLHLILVEKGDDFEQFSAKFTLDDENASEYDERAINDSDIPSLSQLQLYAEYKLYSVLYDLNDPDVELNYGITVPKIPESVKEAIEFYAGDLFSQVYVLGTVNIEMANLLIDGNFYPSSGLDMSSAEIKANLQAVQNAYLEAILGDFIN
ncbi:MAG: hypothetical protein RBR66_04790, partial [Candidatus Izemoplasmatales bacterium]|nr:hypothetical protein [Candidatus Izemoplasmatales bacterium]